MKKVINEQNRFCNRISSICLGLLFVTFFLSSVVKAEDMRALQVEAQDLRRDMMEKAAHEKAAAETAAAESRNQILQARESLEKAIADQESANTRLKKESEGLLKESRLLDEQEAKLTEELRQTDRMIDELVGAIRVSAKDVDGLIVQNPQTAMDEAHSHLFRCDGPTKSFSRHGRCQGIGPGVAGADRQHRPGDHSPGQHD
jgi:small-conductance mechanosensitive channel